MIVKKESSNSEKIGEKMKRTILLLMTVFVFVGGVEAGHLDLVWDANSESDLKGYKVYYGTESQSYINFIDVGNVTSYRLDNLLDGVAFFIALTAYDTSDNESDFSEEVSGTPRSEGTPIEEIYIGGGGSSGGCFIRKLK